MGIQGHIKRVLDKKQIMIWSKDEEHLPVTYCVSSCSPTTFTGTISFIPVDFKPIDSQILFF